MVGPQDEPTQSDGGQDPPFSPESQETDEWAAAAAADSAGLADAGPAPATDVGPSSSGPPPPDDDPPTRTGSDNDQPSANDSGSTVVEEGAGTLFELMREKWGVWLTLFVLLGLVATAVTLFTTLTFSWETAVNPRQITLFSDRFRPVIVHNSVYMETPFAMAEGQAFFVGSIDAGERPDLVGLDLQNGDLVWREPAEADQFPVAVPGIVYIEQRGTTAQILARSTATGEVIWTSDFRFFGGSRVDYLARVDDALSVRLTGDVFGSYYQIDLETGQIVQQKRSDTEFVYLIDRDPLRVYEATPGLLRAVGRNSWQTEVTGFHFQPLVSGNVILLQYQPFNAGYDVLMAVSRRTGDILWQRTDPVLGNTAVYEDTAFTLVNREGGTQLLALDTTSGEMVGSVLFTGSSEESERPAFVAATAGSVGVYFGDGRQLFVFDWLPPAE